MGAVELPRHLRSPVAAGGYRAVCGGNASKAGSGRVAASEARVPLRRRLRRRCRRCCPVRSTITNR